MRFAVIGDPIAHSLSPKMHNAAYAALGLDHTYEAIRVPVDTVATELSRLREEGYTGVNVTVPLKEAAYLWSTPDAFAACAQAVNTLRLSDGIGINTDGPGIVQVIGSTVPSVLLLGAGGSARAIALALADAGHRVVIWNRHYQRAEDLAQICGCQADLYPNFTDFEIVINATSSSMAGELPEIVLDQPPPINGRHGTAIDLYYSSQPTAFMSHFAAMNWRTMDGRELLVAQGALAFEFWLGVPAPLEAMRAAVGL